MNIEELIHKCKNKDSTAQSELYQLFSGKLFVLCLKYSRNYEEAEDNLQDAFLTIFDKISQYTYKGSFEGWLKRIVINTALQRYRKKVNLLNVVDEKTPYNMDVEINNFNVDIDFLLTSIQELPDRYRLVFNLYVLDNYKHKDIAELLNISIGTSKSNLSRARVILKNKIEHYTSTVQAQLS